MNTDSGLDIVMDSLEKMEEAIWEVESDIDAKDTVLKKASDASPKDQLQTGKEKGGWGEKAPSKDTQWGGGDVNMDRDRGRSRSPTREEQKPLQSGTAIFVGNLPYRTDERDLRERFSQYGEIVHAVVPTNRDGRSKGFGVIEYKDSSAASEAIKAMHETDFMGRKIFVREDLDSKSRPSAGRSRERYPESRDRHQYGNGGGGRYESYGKSGHFDERETDYNRDRRSDYAYPSEQRYPADRDYYDRYAYGDYRGGERADYYPPPTSRYSDYPRDSYYTGTRAVEDYGSRRSSGKNTLIVENLPPQFKSGDLWDLFARTGKLVQADIDPSQRGDSRSSRIGIVEYQRENDMRRAQREMDGLQVLGCKLRVQMGGDRGETRRDERRDDDRRYERGYEGRRNEYRDHDYRARSP
ncbi:hypothetical protein MIR68_006556 [Amoeboaphelidium protococcarum]|nr:hypothetical protein MIR68_006556 [Amoeboaphelidium protococcarum]